MQSAEQTRNYFPSDQEPVNSLYIDPCTMQLAHNRSKVRGWEQDEHNKKWLFSLVGTCNV